MTGKSRTRTLLPLAVVAMASLVLTTTSANAAVIFSESFEAQDITADTDYQWVISGFNIDGPWPGWVGVNRYTGMCDKAANVAGSEMFINPFGDQVAYIFNNLPGEDTGASLTTTADSLNAALLEYMTYTLTFNTASLQGNAINYHVELLAINESDPGNIVETVLGSATGPIASNDLSANSDSIVFVSPEGHASLGERLAVRLRKGNGDWHYNVYYDNLQLDASPTLRTLYWDGLGDGNWGTTRWLDKDGNAVDWFPDVADPANAEINANTVTVAENRQVALLTVGGGGVAVADGKALTVLSTASFAEGTSLSLGVGAGFSADSGSIASVALAGDATVSVTDGALDVASLTSAGGTLTKQGAGTLSAQSVAADPTTAFRIREGTFAVGGAKPLGDSTTLVLSGGTFRVTGEETLLPGLMVGTLPGNINTDDENPGNLGVDPLGPTIANGTVSGGNTTWVLTGEVQDINGDGVLSFYENLDDKARLTVEGTANVLNNDSWNTPTGGTVAVTPGAWVPFELRFSNGTGPGAAESDPGFGFGWSDVDTSADANKALYSFTYNDPGVTELFRTLAAGPIDMTGVALTVTADSTIDVVTQAWAAFGAPTMEAGVLTTTSPTNAPVTFQGVNIAPTATRVGFDPQTPTTYGPIANNSTQPKLTIVKAGPSTWSLDAAPVGAAGTTNVTWEVQDGTFQVAGSEPLGSRPVVMAGGRLKVVPPGAVPIANPGFEDPVLADGDWSWSMNDQGWGYSGNDGYQGSWNVATADFPGEAPEGENVGWAEGEGMLGGFAQVLTDPDATLKAGMTYTLTVQVGHALTTDPFGGYQVQLLAGGTPHTPGTGGDYTGPVTGGTLLAEDDNLLTIAQGTFETSTVTYTYDPELHSALLGKPLQIRLIAYAESDEVEFDDVRLTEVITGSPPPVVDLSGVDVTVTADSIVDVDKSLDGAFRSLTLHDGATLTTAGAPISFTGTTIAGENVGIMANVDTTLTRVVGLDAGSHDATVAVKGPGRVILDKLAVSLDAGDTFRLQDGGTLGLLLQDAGSPAGTAAFDFAGGGVLLSSAAGDPDPTHRTWNAAITAGGPGRIAAGPLPGGVDAATITVGGTVSLSGLATLSLEAEGGYTLNIAGDIVGDGGVKGTGGTVNINSAAATYTGGTAVSGGEVNLNTLALSTAHVEVTGGVLNLNADVTTNGGLEAGSVDYGVYAGVTDRAELSGIDNGIDNDATNGGLFALDPTDSAKSTDNMNRPPTKGNNYSDMWSGVLFAPESGEYTFRVHGDDQEVLFIDLDRDGDFEFSNHEDITNNIENHWNTPTTGTATLTAGQAYSFALAHMNGTGGVFVEFQMQMPGEDSLIWVNFGDGKWGHATPSQTTVDAGVLNVADGVTLTTGEVTISGGGTLDVKSTGTLATTKVTMDSGTLTVPHDLNLTELNYSGGTLNLGGNLAVSDRLMVGGPLNMTGKTLTTTAGVTKVDVLAGGALTVDAPLVGDSLTVAGSLATPGFDFGSVTVTGALDTSADATSTDLDLKGDFQLNTNGNRITVAHTVKAGGVTVTATSGTFAVINPGPSNKADTIDLNGAVVTVKGPPEVPTEGLQLWLDASTLGLNDGDTVTVWADQSGLGADRDAVLAGVGSGNPSYVASGPNGVPVVHFDGDDWLATNHNFDSDLTGYTIFSVARYAGGGGTQARRVISSRDGRNWLFGFHDALDERWHANGWIHDTGAMNTEWHLHAGTITDEADPKAAFWKEGNLLTENDTGSGAGNDYKPARIELGGWKGGSETSVAEVAEVLLYSGVLTADQLNAIGGYLSGKYGLTTSYPTSTPGEVAALNNVTGDGKMIGDVLIGGAASPGPADAVGKIEIEGSLTMGDDSIYEWGLGAGEGNYDKIDVTGDTGDLTLPETWTLALRDLGGLALDVDAADEFDLFTYTGTYTGDGSFVADDVIDGSAVSPALWDFSAAWIEHDSGGQRVYLTGLIISAKDGALKWAAGADGVWGEGAPGDWVLVGDWNGPEPEPNYPDDLLVAAVVDTPWTVSVQDIDRKAFSLEVSGGGRAAVAAGRVLELKTGAVVEADGELEVGGKLKAHALTTAGAVTVGPDGALEVDRVTVTGGVLNVGAGATVDVSKGELKITAGDVVSLSEDFSAKSVWITGGTLNTGDKGIDVSNMLRTADAVVTSDAPPFQVTGSGQPGEITVAMSGTTTTVTPSAESGGTLSAPGLSFRATRSATIHADATEATLGDLSVTAQKVVTLTGAPEISFRDVSGGGGVEGNFSVRGRLRPGDGIGSLMIIGSLAIEQGGGLALDVQGTNTADMLLISDALDLSEADDAIAPSWVPGSDANSKFGGRYLAAMSNRDTEGIFDDWGGGNIGADYIADVEYNVPIGGGSTKGIYLTLHELMDGDTDLDGEVDFLDYFAIKSGYGAPAGGTWADGDSDFDGDVGFDDYIAAEGNFGSSPAGGGELVPEPATLALLALGGLVMLRRRRA